MARKTIKDSGGFVFSTTDGALCPGCQQSKNDCICRELAAKSIPDGDGVVRITRETKGRKGAGVTILNGIQVKPNDLKGLAKELKKKCGTGGAVKDGTIELQGDVREHVKTLLEKKGFKVKICGG